MNIIKKSIPMLFGLLLMSTAKAETAAHYTIYPVPQSASYGTEEVNLTNQINVLCERGIDKYTKARIEEVLGENKLTPVYSEKPSSRMTNLYIGIHGSKGVADRFARRMKIDASVFDKAGKYDRYYLSLQKGKGQGDLLILGEHTNAAFFALASLEQLLEQGHSLKTLQISDYADMKYRGIVEGYYGYPYSFAAKKDLMRFFKRYKMNTYLYGAKSDPYHSGFWRDAYPEKITPEQESRGWLSQGMIKELSEVSLETKVNFIWAIHPNSGKAVDFSTDESTQKGVEDVAGKFRLMHDAGVRQFAVFLDDAGWDLKDVNHYSDFLTNLQKTMENTYNKNYKEASDTVLPLHYVPHIYAINFASEKDRNVYFGAIKTTPSQIVVYTTGSGVWSTPTNRDFVTMEKHMDRKVALWWNYPCNDNMDSRIYTADMYTTLREMGLGIPDKSIPDNLGITSNPMQEGEVAKICLFGVADYAWNTQAFNSMDNWNHSFEAIVGKELAPVYRFFSRYARYKDPRTMIDLVKQYKQDLDNGKTDAPAFVEQLDSIKQACSQMKQLAEGSEPDRLLFTDLKPWILKLSEMADLAKSFINARRDMNQPNAWLRYTQLCQRYDALSTNPEFQVETLEGMGENPPKQLHVVQPSNEFLAPFLQYMRDKAFNGFFDGCGNNNGTSVFSNSPSIKGQVESGQMSGQYMTLDGISMLKRGEYVGMCLSEPFVPSKIQVADSLLRNYAVEYSLNGKSWQLLKEGKVPAGTYVKYVRITNRKYAHRTLQLSEKCLSIIPPQYASINHVAVPDGDIWEHHDPAYIIDNNYNTFMAYARGQKKGDAFTLTIKRTPIHDVRVCMGTANGDYMKMGHVEISEDSVKWTALPVMGTDNVDFTMDLPAVKKYSDNMSYCDFNGKGIVACYVRLVINEPKTDKWLRLYDMQVNRLQYAHQFLPTAVDGTGQTVNEVCDGVASTAFSPKEAGMLTYRFLNRAKPDEVIIFCSNMPERIDGALPNVKVTTDGTHWIDKGTLGNGINRISMSDCRNAVKMVVEWKDLRPTINEICEQSK